MLQVAEAFAALGELASMCPAVPLGECIPSKQETLTSIGNKAKEAYKKKRALDETLQNSSNLEHEMQPVVPSQSEIYVKLKEHINCLGGLTLAAEAQGFNAAASLFRAIVARLEDVVAEQPRVRTRSRPVGDG